MSETDELMERLERIETLLTDRQEPDRILRTAEVAQMCGVDEAQVRQWARDEGLPRHQVGQKQKYRFLRSEVLEWLRSR